MTLTVAAIQCAGPGSRSTDAQMQHVMNLVEQAADQGARLVVLPELITSRYFPQDEPTPDRLADAHHLAQPLPATDSASFTARLHDLAQRRDIRIIASVYEQADDQQQYFNTLVLITPDDEVAATYRKVHIPDDPRFYERPYFAPGDEHTVWPDAGMTLGPMICYDQWYPEAARIATLAGAQVLVYPTAIGWDRDESQDEQQRQREAWITIQRSHAIANMVFIIACNRVGTENALTFWGGSFIAAPGGQILTQADDHSEQIITAELDLKRIDKLRAIWPLLADRRPQVYAPLIQPPSRSDI